MAGIRVNQRIVIPEEQIQWSFARSGGPGGQNVNKVNSKATLRWTPPEGFLPNQAWHRFETKAKRFLTTDGEVVIQSQEHREQAQNVDACKRKLRDLLRSALTPPKKRIPTKPTRASKRRRLDEKKKRSDRKRQRQSKDLW